MVSIWKCILLSGFYWFYKVHCLALSTCLVCKIQCNRHCLFDFLGCSTQNDTALKLMPGGLTVQYPDIGQWCKQSIQQTQRPCFITGCKDCFIRMLHRICFVHALPLLLSAFSDLIVACFTYTFYMLLQRVWQCQKLWHQHQRLWFFILFGFNTVRMSIAKNTQRTNTRISGAVNNNRPSKP